MHSVYNLRIASLIKEELDLVLGVLMGANIPVHKQERGLELWTGNRDFTIIGLYKKPPRYIQGRKVYAAYYNNYDESTETFPDDSIVVKKSFADTTAPRTLNIPTVAADDVANTATLGGDLTQYIDNGDTHNILDGTTYAFKNQRTVQSVALVGGNTVITYDDFASGDIAVGDITNFVKGEKLVGLELTIEWYNDDATTNPPSGSVGLTKTVPIPFSTAQSAVYEYRRRRRTVDQMIAEAKGTAIQPYVTAIFHHYETEIKEYLELGDSDMWKTAIDNETDPTINAYLDIEIPVTDLEGNTTLKKLRDHIKDELYTSY